MIAYDAIDHLMYHYMISRLVGTHNRKKRTRNTNISCQYSFKTLKHFSYVVDAKTVISNQAVQDFPSEHDGVAVKGVR